MGRIGYEAIFCLSRYQSIGGIYGMSLVQGGEEESVLVLSPGNVNELRHRKKQEERCFDWTDVEHVWDIDDPFEQHEHLMWYLQKYFSRLDRLVTEVLVDFFICFEDVDQNIEEEFDKVKKAIGFLLAMNEIDHKFQGLLWSLEFQNQLQFMQQLLVIQITRTYTGWHGKKKEKESVIAKFMNLLSSMWNQLHWKEIVNEIEEEQFFCDFVTSMDSLLCTIHLLNKGIHINEETAKYVEDEFVLFISQSEAQAEANKTKVFTNVLNRLKDQFNMDASRIDSMDLGSFLRMYSQREYNNDPVVKKQFATRVIPDLFVMNNCKTEYEKERRSNVLRRISKQTEYHEVLGDDFCINLFLNFMLRSSSHLQKENALVALRHLSIDRSIRLRILKAGGIESFHELLFNGTNQQKIMAAAGLMELTGMDRGDQNQVPVGSNSNDSEEIVDDSLSGMNEESELNVISDSSTNSDDEGDNDNDIPVVEAAVTDPDGDPDPDDEHTAESNEPIVSVPLGDTRGSSAPAPVDENIVEPNDLLSEFDMTFHGPISPLNQVEGVFMNQVTTDEDYMLALLLEDYEAMDSDTDPPPDLTYLFNEVVSSPDPKQPVQATVPQQSDSLRGNERLELDQVAEPPDELEIPNEPSGCTTPERAESSSDTAAVSLTPEQDTSVSDGSILERYVMSSPSTLLGLPRDRLSNIGLNGLPLLADDFGLNDPRVNEFIGAPPPEAAAAISSSSTFSSSEKSATSNNTSQTMDNGNRPKRKRKRAEQVPSSNSTNRRNTSTRSGNTKSKRKKRENVRTKPIQRHLYGAVHRSFIGFSRLRSGSYRVKYSGKGLGTFGTPCEAANAYDAYVKTNLEEILKRKRSIKRNFCDNGHYLNPHEEEELENECTCIDVN